MKKKEAIAIFGGSFNPIHQGHLVAAEEISDRLKIDRVIFVPIGSPPHKPKAELIEARHRVEMVKLAVESNPAFSVSAYEAEKKGKSFSIETIRRFREMSGNPAVCFILGLDAFLEIETWFQYREAMNACRYAVVSREGTPIKRLSHSFQAATLEILNNRSRYVDPELAGLGIASAAKGPTDAELAFIRIPNIGISARMIRARIRGGRSIRYLVPERVMSYIYHKELFQEGAA